MSSSFVVVVVVVDLVVVVVVLVVQSSDVSNEPVPKKTYLPFKLLSPIQVERGLANVI